MRHKRTAVLAALLWLLLGVSGPAAAAPAPAPAPAPASTTSTTAPPPPKAYILVDANTGAVLEASQERVPRPPASLTKILTALAASATLPHDGTLTISERAAAQPANKAGAKAGEVWPIDEAMHLVLMQSSNDLALAFAEAVGGTAEGFQEVLARTAAAVGMEDPQRWRDPAGLDDEESVGGGNIVSARDLAIAGRAMIADPWLSPMAAKPRHRFTDPAGVVREPVNHNKLVLGRYPGAIGGKTGYTKKSGNSLFASAQRDGRTMVTVVMDSRDAYGFTSKLFDKGFATPVADQDGLDRLPPLRLPTAAKIRPVDPPPVVPQVAADTPAEQAAEPAALGPDGQSRAAAPPLPLEEVRAGAQAESTPLPIVAGGAAAVVAVVFVGRRHASRRRRRYYQAPTRRPGPPA